MREPDFAFYSDVGGRANNEDAYLAKNTMNGYLFVVADGLGGHDDGEMASSTAVSAVKEYLMCNQCTDVVSAVKFANEKVLLLQKAKSSRMKTTIAVAYVTEGKTYIAHVGDTRIYAFKDGKRVFQTIDHSASQMAVSLGEIRPEEIRSHADRNVLTRALGAGEGIKVDTTELANSEYSALLLCSDGFWEYVLETDMENELQNAKAADKWLYKLRAIQLNRAPTRCDNNTAIAVLL